MSRKHELSLPLFRLFSLSLSASLSSNPSRDTFQVPTRLLTHIYLSIYLSASSLVPSKPTSRRRAARETREEKEREGLLPSPRIIINLLPLDHAIVILSGTALSPSSLGSSYVQSPRRSAQSRLNVFPTEARDDPSAAGVVSPPTP